MFKVIDIRTSHTFKPILRYLNINNDVQNLKTTMPTSFATYKIKKILCKDLS